jgi:formyl-CoA transferase
MTPFRDIADFPRHEPRPGGKKLALEGVRVIDFTRFLAGPWCTQTLADFGAEVIKIENPGVGDETRTYTPPDIVGQSPYFLGLNRNKYSIALDLSLPAGAGVARELARGADIVVENFAPRMMARFGLDYEALKAVNPRLIFCSISGYGSQSSLADQPGFDSVFQAESGFLSLTGDPAHLPMRTGSRVIDIAAAMNATTAILAALAARERHGVGQHVEVALYDTAVTMLAYFSMNYLAGGKDPVRMGNAAPVATPIGMFETADGGAIYVSCGTQRTWEKFAVAVLGRRDLADNPKYATNRLRNQHKAELMDLIADIVRREPRDAWMERVHREKVPAGAVRSVGKALHAPVALEKRLVTLVADAAGQMVPNIASPFRMSETPVADPVVAPRLNQDLDAILVGLLGYDTSRIDELASAGAFGAAKV